MLARLVSLAFAGIASLALGPLACGPSFQVIYEGDARFEHCYALDESPQVTMQEKTDCWSQWLQRSRALQEVHSLPTDEAIMGAAPGGGEGFHRVNEPSPTSAFTSPPKTMNEDDAGHEGPPAMPKVEVEPPTFVATPVAPKEECTGTCRATWQTCKTPCKGPACAACDKTYGLCMKGCFK